MRTARTAPPLEQLQLIHAELNRQRDATVDKHRTMYQRASLLIGAASLVTGVRAARVPAAIPTLVVESAKAGWSDWNTVHPLIALVLAALATLFALLAGIQGVRTIMIETGGEIDVQKLANNVLAGPADLYTAEWSLVRDQLDVHVGDMVRLEGRRKLFTSGAVCLVVSWLLAIAQFTFSAN